MSRVISRGYVLLTFARRVGPAARCHCSSVLLLLSALGCLLGPSVHGVRGTRYTTVPRERTVTDDRGGVRNLPQGAYAYA